MRLVWRIDASYDPKGKPLQVLNVACAVLF